MSRINIEDLPPLETLSDEEQATIVGAGRLLRLERLEDRIAKSTTPLPTTAISNLGNQTVQFVLRADSHLIETVGTRQIDLGSGIKGLFQGHDASGHQVAYAYANSHLYEFTPTVSANFVAIGSPVLDQIFQDQSHDLFFLQSGNLFEATGVPAAGAVGERVVATNLQGTFQCKDSAGQPVTYALEGGKVYMVTGTGLQQVVGPAGVTKPLVDGQGRLFVLGSSNTLYAINDGSVIQATPDVTQVALDPTGEVVGLKGPHAYQYFGNGQLGTSGADGALGSATAVQYALDGCGDLFRLQGSDLSLSSSAIGGFQRVATGVTQMAVDTIGEVVVLQGPHAYQYFTLTGLSVSGTTVTGGTSSPPLYILDSVGTLYTLAAGEVTIAGNSSSAPIQIGRGGVATSDGSIWYLTLTTQDTAGDRAILQIEPNGELGRSPGVATGLSVSGGTLIAGTAGGNLSVVTTRGLVPILRNLQGLTPLSNGQFVFHIGGVLAGNVAVGYNATTGASTLTFTNTRLNLGAVGATLDNFISNLKRVAQTLSPLFTPIAGLQGLANDLHYGGTLDLASLLRTAAQTGTLSSQATSAINNLGQLESLYQEINALPTLNGSSFLLPTFTATVSGTSFGVGPLGGNLLQQLFGLSATDLQPFQKLGISIPTTGALIQSLLSGNGNLALLTYNLSSIPPFSTSITVPVAAIPTPIPGVTVNGSLIITPSLSFGGFISLTASGLLNGNFAAGLIGKPTATASVSVAAAVSIDLGTTGFDIYGYLVGVKATVSSTGTFSQGAFSASPPVEKNTVINQPVGPNLDPKVLLNIIAQDNPLSLEYSAFQRGLSKAGVNLPTVSQLQSQVSNGLTSIFAPGTTTINTIFGTHF